MYWQICEGSTGDEQPYKGTPVDSAYEIDYYTWQDFRHQCWDSASTYAGKNRYFRFLFNSGNNSQDLQYVESKFPEDFQKMLLKNPKAKQFFDSLSYSNKQRYILPLGQAKTEETRQRRMEKAITDLSEGKK